MVLLYKLLGFCIGVVVVVPLGILVCLPYLLAASMADKEEYWSAFPDNFSELATDRPCIYQSSDPFHARARMDFRC
jgi:hypothetical protein